MTVGGILFYIGFAILLAAILLYMARIVWWTVKRTKLEVRGVPPSQIHEFYDADFQLRRRGISSKELGLVNLGFAILGLLICIVSSRL